MGTDKGALYVRLLSGPSVGSAAGDSARARGKRECCASATLEEDAHQRHKRGKSKSTAPEKQIRSEAVEAPVQGPYLRRLGTGAPEKRMTSATGSVRMPRWSGGCISQVRMN